MFFLIKLIIGLVILALALGFFRTWQVENSDNQKKFAAGKAPSTALDGLYHGSVSTPIKVTWLGKKFIAASSTGINVFEDGSSTTERYPFATALGISGSTTVLNIKYDLPENPFWLRPVLDQLVEIAPGDYLGKLTVLVVPGYPFSLGFFKLIK